MRAHCKCPAGIDGRCNHVAATLFALEQHCKEKQTIIDSNESCTSKPCKWSVPRKRKGPVPPIKQINVVKHDYAKPNKRPKLETKHSTPPKILAK